MKTLGEILNIESEKKIYASDGSEYLRTDKELLKRDKEILKYIPQVDEGYKFRENDIKVILISCKLNKPAYLFGYAGVGKTTLIEQFCARTNRPFVRVQHTSNIEESHIVGQYIVRKDKEGKVETKFELGPLAYAMKNGLVYCADEYDFAHPSVLSVYQAILEGKHLYLKEADEENRIIEPHPDFRFIATGNTNGSGDTTGLFVGTNVQNCANYERFALVHKVDYMNQEDEFSVLCSKFNPNIKEGDSQFSVKKDIIMQCIDFANAMRKGFANGSAQFPPSVRVVINALNIGWAVGDFREGWRLSYLNRMDEDYIVSAEATMCQYISEY